MTPRLEAIPKIHPLFANVLTRQQANQVYVLNGFVFIEDSDTVLCMLVSPNGVFDDSDILHAEHGFRLD